MIFYVSEWEFTLLQFDLWHEIHLYMWDDIEYRMDLNFRSALALTLNGARHDRITEAR